MKLKILMLMAIISPHFSQAQVSECDFLDPIYWITSNFRQDFGDTLSIKKISAYLESESFNKSHPDFEQDSILPRYFFPMLDYSNILYVGRYLDEGEYLSFTLYSIDKKTCEILSKYIIAEVTAWESGHRETLSLFKNHRELICFKKSGDKDWGDGKLWSKMEKTISIELTPSGKIETEILNKRKYYTKSKT
jgi:hypothetical protein